MFKRTNPEIVVAGAGPVGRFAALALARHGLKVEIVDTRWQHEIATFALTLHPRTLELLEDLGLASAALAHAHRFDTISLYEGRERLAQLTLSALPTRFPFVSVLPEGELEGLLSAALAERHSIGVQWNHRLSRVQPRHDAASVTIDELGMEETGYAIPHIETVIDKSRELEAAIVLGADGQRSLIRNQMDIAFETVQPAVHHAVYEFTANGAGPRELCLALGDGTVDVLLPLPGDRYRATFEVALPPATTRNTANAPSDELDDALLVHLLAVRMPWFLGTPREVSWSRKLDFEHRLARAYGEGRVRLVGDAMHTTSPTGAHSMNVGLAEVVEVAATAADVVARRVSADALAAHDSERRAEWQHLLGAQGHVVAAGTRAPDAVRRHAAEIVRNLPLSGSHLETAMRQIGLHWSAAA